MNYDTTTGGAKTLSVPAAGKLYFDLSRNGSLCRRPGRCDPDNSSWKAP